MEIDADVVLNNTICLDDLQCIGNETSLLLCEHEDTGIHDCLESQKMAVRCSPKGKPFFSN